MVGDTTPDDGEVTGTDESDGFGTCSECGRLVLADQERCSQCSSEPASRPGAPAPGKVSVGADHPFKPTGTLAISLRMVFTALILMEGFVLGAIFVLERMSGRLIENPFAYTLTEYENQQQLLSTLSWVETAFMGVLAVLFMAWMYRSLGNLPAIGAFQQRYGKRWGIGSWFIPIGNLWIPKRLADDLWRSSGPDTKAQYPRPASKQTDSRRIDEDWQLKPSEPAVGMIPREPAISEAYVGSGAGWAATDSWHFRSVHRNVHWWWAAFLSSRILFGFVNASMEGGDPVSVRNGIRILFVATLITIAGAALAIWLVSTISKRQAERIRETGRSLAERDSTRGLTANIVIASVLAVALSVFGYLYFSTDETSIALGGGGGTEEGHYEGFGISFDYDSDYMAAVSGLVGDEPNELGGGVLMGRLGSTDAGAITWAVSPGITEADYMALADEAVNGVASEAGPGVLIDRSDPITLDGGPTPFSARNFRITADTFVLEGAVAVGGCAVEAYMVIIVWIDEKAGPSGTIDTSTNRSEMKSLLEVLTTVEC